MAPRGALGPEMRSGPRASGGDLAQARSFQTMPQRRSTLPRRARPGTQGIGFFGVRSCCSSLRRCRSSTPSRPSKAPIRRIGADIAVANGDTHEVDRPNPPGAEIGANPVVGSRHAAEPGPIVDRVDKSPGTRRVNGRLAIGGLLLFSLPQALIRHLDEGQVDRRDCPISGKSVVVGVDPVGKLVVVAVAIEGVRATDLVAALAVCDQRY